MLPELFFSLVLAAAFAGASPPPTPAPIPTGTPAGTASPSPSPASSPTPTPTPRTTPTPLLTPSPLPTPIMLPAAAPPQIVAVRLSDNAPHGGETVNGTVVTSSNVAAVELRLEGYAIRFARQDVGVWQLSYTVPRVPFWARKRYSAQIVAMNSSGLESSTSVDFRLR